MNMSRKYTHKDAQQACIYTYTILHSGCNTNPNIRTEDSGSSSTGTIVELVSDVRRLIDRYE